MPLILDPVNSFLIAAILYLITSGITALLPLATGPVTEDCDWLAMTTSMSFTTDSLRRHFQL